MEEAGETPTLPAPPTPMPPVLPTPRAADVRSDGVDDAVESTVAERDCTTTRTRVHRGKEGDETTENENEGEMSTLRGVLPLTGRSSSSSSDTVSSASTADVSGSESSERSGDSIGSGRVPGSKRNDVGMRECRQLFTIVRVTEKCVKVIE